MQNTIGVHETSERLLNALSPRIAANPPSAELPEPRRPYPALPTQAAVFPNALSQTVPSADENLLGLSLTCVSRQIVSVV